LFEKSEMAETRLYGDHVAKSHLKGTEKRDTTALFPSIISIMTSIVTFLTEKELYTRNVTFNHAQNLQMSRRVADVFSKSLFMHC
jgi:hypothetical protein